MLTVFTIWLTIGNFIQYMFVCIMWLKKDSIIFLHFVFLLACAQKRRFSDFVSEKDKRDAFLMFSSLWYILEIYAYWIRSQVHKYLNI